MASVDLTVDRNRPSTDAPNPAASGAAGLQRQRQDVPGRPGRPATSRVRNPSFAIPKIRSPSFMVREKSDDIPDAHASPWGVEDDTNKDATVSPQGAADRQVNRSAKGSSLLNPGSASPGGTLTTSGSGIGNTTSPNKRNIRKEANSPGSPMSPQRRRESSVRDVPSAKSPTADGDRPKAPTARSPMEGRSRQRGISFMVRNASSAGKEPAKSKDPIDPNADPKKGKGHGRVGFSDKLRSKFGRDSGMEEEDKPKGIPKSKTKVGANATGTAGKTRTSEVDDAELSDEDLAEDGESEGSGDSPTSLAADDFISYQTKKDKDRGHHSWRRGKQK